MKSRKKKFLFFISLILMIGFGGAWWWSGDAKSQSAGSPPTVKVSRRDFASTVLATGAVRPQVGAEVKVGARISGRVEKLFVNVGDQVLRKDILAKLEARELTAQVALSQADVDVAKAGLLALKTERPKEIVRAEATVTDAKAILRLANVNWQRIVDLQQRGVATDNELDTAKQELDSAGARVSLVKAGLDLAKVRMPNDIRIAMALVASKEARLDETNARLAYATIDASISGTVASVTTQEGETVAAGLNAPTFVTIIDLARLQVDAFVDEVDIGKIKIGQPAYFTVDTFPDREFTGRVSAIYPKAVIQENVVNYDVVITIDGNYKDLLRPEMTTNVTIYLEERLNVLTIPSRALQRQRGNNIVYVQTPNGSKSCKVTVGMRDGRWVEILDGISEGEVIFLKPPASAGIKGTLGN